MQNYVEIRWHGRAQQGVVTAAKVLGEAALRMGRYVQAFPDFGPERMGAPVRAFNRISSSPINVHSQNMKPKIVLVVDTTLQGTVDSLGRKVDVREGTPEDAVFIINTPATPQDMRRHFDFQPKAKVFTVDASRIAMDCIDRHTPNTPMLGALAKVTGVVELDALIDNFKENYAKKYSPQVIEGNLLAIRRGYEEVRE
ncbi:MAG: 2-oxoacid:acceptor oxidoreductase family protein [Deltaproteobacteria bacterium]|nr:2-oxoacid:acceptor oxidoreductase family protein [Deltaproteobacteria bacterium]